MLDSNNNMGGFTKVLPTTSVDVDFPQFRPRLWRIAPKIGRLPRETF
jgi:hypothetical protein